MKKIFLPNIDKSMCLVPKRFTKSVARNLMEKDENI